MYFKNIKVILLVLLAVLVLAFGQTSCKSSSPGQTKLTVLVADSLIIPFQELEKAFEAQHSDIDVYIEGHGSIQVIRSITELGKEADVAAVADNQLIPLLMYSARIPDSDRPYANWYINFATNTLGIAYTDKSPFAAEINTANWYDIMSRPEVRIGLSDPAIDSLAYRSLMVVQLAQKYYQDNSIFDKLIASNFKLPINVNSRDEITTILIPMSLKPVQNRVVLRSYNIQILALLESGDVDYSFEYKSVAKQHGLKFLSLPTDIDLSSPQYADLYQQIRVRMDFQRFKSVNPEFVGAPIVYGITVPKNAAHPSEAIRFVQFVLGSDGQDILTKNFQPPLIPAESDNRAAVPDDLRRWLK